MSKAREGGIPVRLSEISKVLREIRAITEGQELKDEKILEIERLADNFFINLTNISVDESSEYFIESLESVMEEGEKIIKGAVIKREIAKKTMMLARLKAELSRISVEIDVRAHESVDLLGRKEGLEEDIKYYSSANAAEGASEVIEEEKVLEYDKEKEVEEAEALMRLKVELSRISNEIDARGYKSVNLLAKERDLKSAVAEEERNISEKKALKEALEKDPISDDPGLLVKMGVFLVNKILKLSCNGIAKTKGMREIEGRARDFLSGLSKDAKPSASVIPTKKISVVTRGDRPDLSAGSLP